MPGAVGSTTVVLVGVAVIPSGRGASAGGVMSASGVLVGEAGVAVAVAVTASGDGVAVASGVKTAVTVIVFVAPLNDG